MKLLLSFAFTLLAIATYAQTILTPGKKSFEKKWIQNQRYQMTWFALKDTSRIEIGDVMTDMIKSKNRLTIITQVKLKNSATLWVDTTIANITTLKPIRHTSTNGQRDMVLYFGTIVTGYYHDKVKKENIEVQDLTNQPYFDSNLYPVLISWLPLEEGYKKEIAIYDYSPSGQKGGMKAFVTDVKSGTYASLVSDNRHVWVVSVNDEIGDGNKASSTYFIDKADRRIWKQEITSARSKNSLSIK